uniref:MARVEL domain-containing protein n=1 Tax=Globodera pallida TaxID=36090 RepID=A0A183BYI1_GLOPA
MLKSGDEEIENAQEEKSKTISIEQEAKQPTSRTNTNASEKHSPTKGFGRMNAKVKIIPESRKGQLNTRYLATLPGLLKVVEVILGFVAFILAICADRRSTSSAWAEHITFETTVVVSVLILLYVVFPHLTLADERTREGLVVVELFFYGINTLFFFIGILCLALCLMYAGEAYIKFKVWNKPTPTHPESHQGHHHHVPPAPTHYNETKIERREMDEKTVV